MRKERSMEVGIVGRRENERKVDGGGHSRTKGSGRKP